MTLFFHEMKLGAKALIIWTAVIAVMLAVCVFIYPEMKGSMDEMSDMMASMGSFSEAFGMDELGFGTLLGYYAIECGNVLGIGGALFAALLGIGALAKEEKEHTAEFLLTHPVRRTSVLTHKLIAVIVRVLLLNAAVLAVAVVSMVAIGETLHMKELLLLHTAYTLMQLEIAGICFGVSAFLKKGSLGLGIGVALLGYILNLIANLTESAEFLKYITPFGYTDGAQIVKDFALDGVLIALGMGYMAACIVIGYIWYGKKDIAG